MTNVLVVLNVLHVLKPRTARTNRMFRTKNI